MGFFDFVNGLISDLGNGVAGMFSRTDPATCACCKKCKREFRSGDYKRVFICSDGYGVLNLGTPVLATKVEDISRCYPPCELSEYNFEPYNPENPVEPNPEIIDYNDAAYDWDPNQKEQGSSVDSDDYYQQY